jgi:hypothetical protein
MARSQPSELRAFQKENQRLKKIAADLLLVQLILKESLGFLTRDLTANEMRCAVIKARQKLGTSERRTCKVLGIARRTHRYEGRGKIEDGLRLAMIQLAKQYRRYGYRKVGQLLRMQSWCVNHKKVECIWYEEGLQFPKCDKSSKRRYNYDASVILPRSHAPNHIESIDFSTVS